MNPLFNLLLVPLFTQSFFFRIIGQVDANVFDGNLLLWCFMGCIFQEVIYWYELKKEISNDHIPPNLTSRLYWIITIISIATFTLGSYLYFLNSDQSNPSFLTVAVFAGGFARIFKSAVSNVASQGQAASPRQPVPSNITYTAQRKFNIKDYLLIPPSKK